jgi:AmiR/NasT family two-component response regulator
VFTPRALGAGVAGVCAFPMRLRADRIGALNVFQATPGALDETAALEHALESRVVVEQAKGILAERLGIDPEVAFTRLRRHCRQDGLHLAELAGQVVEGSFTVAQETGQEG